MIAYHIERWDQQEKRWESYAENITGRVDAETRLRGLASAQLGFRFRLKSTPTGKVLLHAGIIAEPRVEVVPGWTTEEILAREG